ncbi:hypothetical protein Clacol_004976 [Clathrus columnatus]|uniref:Uncharacterized protein n=1 Tax=Clathrus columnatus TaxID=1419009 RepID=A0AAV5ADH1_9AGAM|nr:hypothetical protein Clacol_004976 [Clathrus columnatus]
MSNICNKQSPAVPSSTHNFIRQPTQESHIIEGLERTLLEHRALTQTASAIRDEFLTLRQLAVKKVYQEETERFLRAEFPYNETGRQLTDPFGAPEGINIYDLGYDPNKWASHADWMLNSISSECLQKTLVPTKDHRPVSVVVFPLFSPQIRTLLVDPPTEKSYSDERKPNAN